MMKKNHQPILKASFQKCTLAERETFGNSKCILSISVGYKSFEGEKLKAFLELINKSFKTCLMQISDSLQRHTLKIIQDIDDKIAHEQANLLGENWLTQNQALLDLFTIPLEIKRWDEWLVHPRFSEYRSKIDALYEENASFAESFLKNAIEFVERTKKHYPEKSIDEQEALKLSLAYLKEECTVMCLWVLEKCQFEVYPGGRNLAMTATYAHLIQPSFPDLLKPVGIRYKKH